MCLSPSSYPINPDSSNIIIMKHSLIYHSQLQPNFDSLTIPQPKKTIHQKFFIKYQFILEYSMEALLEKSRTIIVNKTYSKYQKERYQNHVKAVNKAHSSQSWSQISENRYFKNLNKYRKACKSIEKQFSNTHLENQSLIRRLIKIDESSTKVKKMVKSMHEGAKKIKLAERLRIEKENEILSKKLTEIKKKTLKPIQLKKKYREHDRLVVHAQKLRN